jgi:hypothetical protein
MLKIEIDLLKLKNIFGVYRPYITLLPTFNIELNVRFQLNVSENKVYFPPSQVHGPSEISRLQTVALYPNYHYSNFI